MSSLAAGREHMFISSIQAAKVHADGSLIRVALPSVHWYKCRRRGLVPAVADLLDQLRNIR